MSLRIPLVLLASTAVIVVAGCVMAQVGDRPGASPGAGRSERGTVSAAPPLGGLTAEDGYTPPGTWLTLDDDVPAIANLDPALRAALEEAAVAAGERNVELSFTDAWRSAAYQQHLFDAAVASYGSEEEARRWVKPADESQHVLGLAVDIATADAMDFLSRFGAEFGLCQIYVNEAWHFELVPGVDGAGVAEECPAPVLDSTAG